eukprot:gnl/TRDRNA2_/TRDRNA2_174083_c0_seq2.p1 gnl/TRDRNA2_/TRDRNA2_174083_c0~~gnl/TRDRNA2_/TRDRNA2_174083_c0_seq2.p1  ORF type:complete len:322 (+),score=34.88 gnl/TRDRNA2_/TRDRNA2_174083_c0_seq2:97-966(+)
MACVGKLFVLLHFVARKLAVADRSAVKVSRRAFTSSSLSSAELEDTTLGKSSHLAQVGRRCEPPLRCTTGMARGGVGSLQPRMSRQRQHVRAACTDCNSELARGRRETGLALSAGLAASVVDPAFAADEAAPASGQEVPFSDGPDGMKFRDLAPGLYTELIPDYKVTVNYILRLADRDDRIQTLDSFEFIAGQGEVIQGADIALLGKGAMPPMKVTGVRQVIIPPELAFGSKGKACGESVSPYRCLAAIPPDSALELIVELVRIKDPKIKTVFDAFASMSTNPESLLKP